MIKNKDFESDLDSEGRSSCVSLGRLQNLSVP